MWSKNCKPLCSLASRFGWITGLLIGTHYRYGKIMNPDRLHGGQGQDFKPGAGSQRLHRYQVHHRTDGKCISCPTSSSANLYWFQRGLVRAWGLQDKFKAKYGYDLGAELECVKISPSSSASTSRP
jgi:glycerol transport system substrate-binding protein